MYNIVYLWIIAWNFRKPTFGSERFIFVGLGYFRSNLIEQMWPCLMNLHLREKKSVSDTFGKKQCYMLFFSFLRKWANSYFFLNSRTDGGKEITVATHSQFIVLKRINTPLHERSCCRRYKGYICQCTLDRLIFHLLSLNSYLKNYMLCRSSYHS